MFTSIIVCWNETQQQLLNNCHFIIFFHAKEQFTTTVQYVSHNFVERLLLYKHPPDSECFKIKIPLAIKIFLLFSLSMWTDDNWSTGADEILGNELVLMCNFIYSHINW